MRLSGLEARSVKSVIGSAAPVVIRVIGRPPVAHRHPRPGTVRVRAWAFSSLL